MGVGIEALFTSALGLPEPWSVKKFDLDTAGRRIDIELRIGRRICTALSHHRMQRIA